MRERKVTNQKNKKSKMSKQNKGNQMEYKRNIGILFLFFVLIAGIVLAQNTTINNTEEKAICSEQLEICVEEFNSLLEDFKVGTNCKGTAYEVLKDANEYLTEERNSCLEEVGGLKVYKGGFYFMFGLFIILLIVYFREILKKSKGLNKTSSEVNNAGKRRKHTKKKNR